jgi:4-hydroxy-3-polyprenylbenzoate decarboxylase
MLDLRDWISRMVAVDEVRNVRGAHRDDDVGPLTQATEGFAGGGPALLFDDIVGYPRGFRILTNVNNSVRRLSCSSFLADCDSMPDLVQGWRRIIRELRAVPPVDVGEGPILENVHEGSDIDLEIFPTPRWHPNDGGRYIGTGDAIITRDPDTGRINVGTYRMMLAGKNSLVGSVVRGKDGDNHRKRYFDKNLCCPVVMSFGHHPLFSLVGASGLREDLSEFDIIGSIVGGGVQVIRGKHTGLPIPAHSEIAIEGEFSPTESISEGPFGEWTGYYASPARKEPIVEVKAIYFRNNPIILGMPPSKPNPSYIQTRILRSIAIEDHLKTCGIPGVKAVWLHLPGGPRYFVAISIRQLYPGHPKQVAAAVLGLRNSNYAGRFVVIVDDDIDVTDLNEVLWAICTRCDPKDGINVIDGFWTSPLDPAVPWESKQTGSRAIIDACWPYSRLSSVPKTCSISKEQRDAMLNKWRSVFSPGAGQRQ